MTCPICKHGDTRDGMVTVTFERGPVTLVVNNVPARVCDNCGEEYLSEQTTKELLAIAEDSARAGVHVAIREFVVSRAA